MRGERGSKPGTRDIIIVNLESLLKQLPLLPPDQTKDESDDDDESNDWTNYILPRRRPPHPHNQLACTSKAWRNLVEGFWGHQLLVHKQHCTNLRLSA